MLCDALEHNFKQRYPNSDPYKFTIESGRKYHKIVMETESQSRSVHAFIDKKTGEVSASWRGPAKHVRFDLRLIKDRDGCMSTLIGQVLISISDDFNP